MTKGSSYEQFVAKLQQAIIDAEPYAQTKNVKLEINKIIQDRNGIEREFDIYWEFEMGGYIYKTIIECKDYNSTIDITKIDALIGKVKDIPEITKAIFATRKGYQAGAKEKAVQNNIELLIIRQQDDRDWQDNTGNHYLRYIDNKIEIYFPAEVIKFTPIFDMDWIRINIGNLKTIHINDLDKNILIEDNKNQEKYSLYDLRHTVFLKNETKSGLFTKRILLDDAYIYLNGEKYKIKGYDAEYEVSEPMELGVKIDFSNEFLGVIEYLQKKKKVEVMKNGRFRESDIY
jgi:hypothetical protein